MAASSESLELARRLRLEIDVLRRMVRARTALDHLPRRQEAALDLLRRKGPLTTAELARWEQVRPQSMGATVAELETAGLVTRTPDPRDGRRVPLELTPAGELELERAAVQRDGDLAELFDTRLTAADRVVLDRAVRLLESIADAR